MIITSVRAKFIPTWVILTLLAALIAGPDARAATNYYVAALGGDDSNPGTIDQPFATIAKARDVVRTVNGSMTGDITVYLRKRQEKVFREGKHSWLRCITV